MPDYKFVQYETLDSGKVARIMLNRPDARNAQNRGLLVELNDAFLRAEADDEVRVVILGGTGPMFSSGHDMGSKVSREEMMPGPDQHPTRGRSTVPRARAPRASCCRSGTTSSRTRVGGAICARSPSGRPTETSTQRA